MKSFLQLLIVWLVSWFLHAKIILIQNVGSEFTCRPVALERMLPLTEAHHRCLCVNNLASLEQRPLIYSHTIAVQLERR